MGSVKRADNRDNAQQTKRSSERADPVLETRLPDIASRAVKTARAALNTATRSSRGASFPQSSPTSETAQANVIRLRLALPPIYPAAGA